MVDADAVNGDWRVTNMSTTPSIGMLGDGSIQFGELLPHAPAISASPVLMALCQRVRVLLAGQVVGVGSFGRVYKGERCDRATAPTSVLAACVHASQAISSFVLLCLAVPGRLPPGRWAGRDVAVKVIEHDTETAAAVENEVQLMLSLCHPNVVRA